MHPASGYPPMDVLLFIVRSDAFLSRHQVQVMSNSPFRPAQPFLTVRFPFQVQYCSGFLLARKTCQAKTAPMVRPFS